VKQSPPSLPDHPGLHLQSSIDVLFNGEIELNGTIDSMVLGMKYYAIPYSSHKWYSTLQNKEDTKKAKKKTP